MRLLTRLARLFVLAVVVLSIRAVTAGDLDPKAKPVFRNFIGLNVHTVQFKPELYKPVTRRVRDYHGFKWDVGDDTDYYPRFPFARIESTGKRCMETGTRRDIRST